MTKKQILITGASTGIGKALAIEYGTEKNKLWLMARSTDKLNEIVGKIKDNNGDAEAIPIDLTDTKMMIEKSKEIEKKSGGIDLLIINAGYSSRLFYHGNDNIDKAQTMIKLNFQSAIIMTEYFVQKMIVRNSGHIVGVASIAGFRGMPNAGVYSATKAGFSTYLEGLRVSLGDHKIFVTTVNPGFVDTPMTQGKNNPKPFLTTPKDAGRMISKAISKKKKRFIFPKPMIFVGWFARNLPNCLFDYFGRKFASKLNSEK
ncbi:MAG: SDR family NAD(P)-dependent oxidoreductase [Candidatus Marinimicrobia bacterium]|nr:SDR family NAD(P)-dependent oxidoreductase [Candidatus Neomarinimicrobiota bacterium]